VGLTPVAINGEVRAGAKPRFHVIGGQAPQLHAACASLIEAAVGAKPTQPLEQHGADQPIPTPVVSNRLGMFEQRVGLFGIAPRARDSSEDQVGSKHALVHRRRVDERDQWLENGFRSA